MVSQVMTSMEGSIKPLMMNSLPPGNTAKSWLTSSSEFHTRADVKIPRLLDAAVPVYDKYFTDDDIKGLIRFYETPVGQKSDRLDAEGFHGTAIGRTKLGQTIGRDAMLKVLTDHPDLKSALEEAEKNPRTLNKVWGNGGKRGKS